jgi:L-threonylcarbamoyladenylate synthase
LGLIVRKKPAIPDFVTASSQSVALVCPNELAAELARLVDGPIAATSADISGQVEILDPSIAATQFEGQVDTIIKGPLQPGILNTLLDLTQSPPAIIREGGVPFEELRRLIPNLKEI